MFPHPIPKFIITLRGSFNHRALEKNIYNQTDNRKFGKTKKIKKTYKQSNKTTHNCQLHNSEGQMKKPQKLALQPFARYIITLKATFFKERSS